MLFNVSQLLRERTGSNRDYVIEAEPPLHRGTAELLRTPDGVLVRASAEVLVEATCSRCLAPFAYPVEIAFEEVFIQQYDVTTGVLLTSESDGESFVITPNHMIDIREAVRQYSEMAAEMQPLCRPDCPGLCPECGTDLTIANCRCEESPIDARWTALAALRRSANG